MKALEEPVANRLLDSFGDILTPDAAARIVDYRFDKKVQTRLKALARRCNEGKLSEKERREYESCIEIMDFIAILQVKARALLKRVKTI